MSGPARAAALGVRPAMPPGRVGGPAAWRGADLARSQEWLHRLAAEQVRELDGAVAQVLRRGLDIIDLTPDDFALPTPGTRRCVPLEPC